jgi:hypothetical protein
MILITNYTHLTQFVKTRPREVFPLHPIQGHDVPALEDDTTPSASSCPVSSGPSVALPLPVSPTRALTPPSSTSRLAWRTASICSTGPERPARRRKRHCADRQPAAALQAPRWQTINLIPCLPSCEEREAVAAARPASSGQRPGTARMEAAAQRRVGWVRQTATNRAQVARRAHGGVGIEQFPGIGVARSL